MQKLDWKTLCDMEPELKRIAEKAITHRRRVRHIRQRAYEAAKAEACRFVGWGACNPHLQSNEAWELFCRYVADRLCV